MGFVVLKRSDSLVQVDRSGFPPSRVDRDLHSREVVYNLQVLTAKWKSLQFCYTVMFCFFVISHLLPACVWLVRNGESLRLCVQFSDFCSKINLCDKDLSDVAIGE